MVLQISQETFDNAVKENVELLCLTEEEAREEAVKQFQAQGVDLDHIIKESMSGQEFEEIHAAVNKLEECNKSKTLTNDLLDALETVKSECEQGIKHRVAAGKVGAYIQLLNLYSTFPDKNVRCGCLKALIALMTKQPDLLDDRGIEFIINNLKDSSQDCELQRLILKWTKECCVMHEMNRQKIFDARILNIIKEFLKEQTPSELIRETLSVCRALVLDDDVRVEFGKAHEHARIIASETLCPLINLLAKLRSEEQLNFDLLLTLTALMVRTEFCKKVEDAGGLELIKSVMEGYIRNEKIVRQSYKLVKALAGNDSVKSALIARKYAPIIIHTLDANKEKATTATAGLACIAALTLRSPDNSKAFFDEGIAEIIVQIMSIHPDQKLVQKTASWAVRNMVSRSKYQTKKFLDLGIEELLQQDLRRFKDIEYDIKAALRDLDCAVKLKEEWTGKGGALNTEAVKNIN